MRQKQPLAVSGAHVTKLLWRIASRPPMLTSAIMLAQEAVMAKKAKKKTATKSKKKKRVVAKARKSASRKSKVARAAKKTKRKVAAKKTVAKKAAPKKAAVKRKPISKAVTAAIPMSMANPPMPPAHKTIGEKISGAYHTVVDTVKETDELRNKLEPPGVSETQ